MKRFLTIACLVGGLSLGFAAGLESVAGGAKADLVQALEELTAARIRARFVEG
jgi:hypothetical protein